MGTGISEVGMGSYQLLCREVGKRGKNASALEVDFIKRGKVPQRA